MIYIFYIVLHFTVDILLKQIRSLVHRLKQYQLFVTITMSTISQPEFVANSVNTDSKKSISKLKSSRRGCIGNLKKPINRITLLNDDMCDYDEVCLLYYEHCYIMFLK